jgi:hypothetical protein
MAEILDSWDSIFSGCHTYLSGRFLRAAIDSFSGCQRAEFFRGLLGSLDTCHQSLFTPTQ